MLSITPALQYPTNHGNVTDPTPSTHPLGDMAVKCQLASWRIEVSGKCSEFVALYTIHQYNLCVI